MLWRWLLLGVGLITLVVGQRFVFLSDLTYLATSWVPDDAFYYLQPARLFPSLGTFSFDGQTPTYGFQPLWMLCLSGLASLGLSAEALLRGSLSLSVILLVFSAFLLFEWLGRGLRGFLGVCLLLLNPAVFHLMVTGMESTVVIPCLLAILLLKSRELKGNWALLLGALCGVLSLSRVELFPLACLLLPWKSRRNLAFSALGMGLILMPWAIFAQVELGGILPTSGSRRLMGSWAGLLLSIGDFAPALGAALTDFLPPLDQDLYKAQAVMRPELGGLFTIGLSGAIEVAWGFWLPLWQGVGARSLALIPGALFVVIAGSIATKKVLDEPRIPDLPKGLLLLGAFAFCRILAAHLLLPAYMAYAYWYRAPEVLFLIGSLAWAIPWAGEAVKERVMILKGMKLYGAVLLLGSIFVYASILNPRQSVPETTYGSRAMLALEWMETELPKGTRVGAWNAGVMGYFSQNVTIVNLDGLANGRDYLNTVVPGEMRLRAKLEGANPTLAYLRTEGIDYIADAEHPDRLGVKAFQEVIPANDYSVVKVLPGRLIWDGSLPTHKLAVLKLTKLEDDLDVAAP